MKRRYLALLLCLVLSLSAAGAAQAVTIDEYGDLFHAVLDNMMDHYAWEDDEFGNPIIGNWDGDEMYDSTLFAPDILYRLALDPDYGDEAARERAFVLAEQTVEYETGVLFEYLFGNEAVMMEAFAGAPCLIDAFKVSRNPFYNLVLTAALSRVRGIVAEEPNFLGDYMGYVCANGLVGFYSLYFADVEKILTAGGAQDIGLEVIGETIERYWDDEAGRFWPIDNLYENGWMLMGLAYAYGATANGEYKVMADAVMHEIDTNLWDDVSGDGGYWEYEDYTYKPALGRWKKLSTHERIARAMLHWFEVTGDTGYLDQARKMLTYTEGHLCAEDCCQPGETVCYHHWTETTGLPHAIADPEDPGYDPYYDNPFCTGCNFNLLIDIYLLNKFVQEADNYPRPIGACGRLASGRAPIAASAGGLMLVLPAAFILVMKRFRGRPGTAAPPTEGH